MTSNKTTSERDDTAIETYVEICDAGPSRSTRSDEHRFQVSRGEKQWPDDEPRLPKGYRHIRSAIEAVLECSGEHASS